MVPQIQGRLSALANTHILDWIGIVPVARAFTDVADNRQMVAQTIRGAHRARLDPELDHVSVAAVGSGTAVSCVRIDEPP